MAEGSSRGSPISLPNENNEYKRNLGSKIKGTIDSNLNTNTSASGMEIGPFVSAETDRRENSSEPSTTKLTKHVHDSLWSEETERDDLLFQDCDSNDEFVWDSERGANGPKLNLLGDMCDESSGPQNSERVKNSFSRESDRLLSPSSDGLYSECTASEHSNGSVIQMDRDDSMWHCHQDSPAKIDTVARNQLIAISVICVIFMIGEIVGMYI